MVVVVIVLLMAVAVVKGSNSSNYCSISSSSKNCSLFPSLFWGLSITDDVFLLTVECE